jgi:hypothetical protein
MAKPSLPANKTKTRGSSQRLREHGVMESYVESSTLLPAFR